MTALDHVHTRCFRIGAGPKRDLLDDHLHQAVLVWVSWGRAPRAWKGDTDMKMAALKQKAELVHAIQQAEGYTPCFGRSTGDCAYTDCCFREDCFKVRMRF